MTHKLFVNIPVQDLQRSQQFFGDLGFQFNPQFTDENAACMILSEEGFVMLLERSFFKTFTDRQITDPTTTVEALLSFSVDSRAEVDRITEQAFAGGATVAKDPVDFGFMYQRSFLDPDGHHWEIVWMDPEQMMTHEATVELS